MVFDPDFAKEVTHCSRAKTVMPLIKRSTLSYTGLQMTSLVYLAAVTWAVKYLKITLKQKTIFQHITRLG